MAINSVNKTVVGYSSPPEQARLHMAPNVGPGLVKSSSVVAQAGLLKNFQVKTDGKNGRKRTKYKHVKDFFVLFK